MEISSTNIYGAIKAVMCELEAIGKNRKVDSGPARYNFRGVDDVYNELHPILAKYGVFTTSELISCEWANGVFKSGGAYVECRLALRWVFHGPDGSSVSHVSVGVGQDTGDKAANKAMSVSHKYALVQVLCIPTVDKKDPEDDHGEIAKPSQPPSAKAETPKQAPAPAADLEAATAILLDLQAQLDSASTEAELEAAWVKVPAAHKGALFNHKKAVKARINGGK
jgi:hypothetical protein